MNDFKPFLLIERTFSEMRLTHWPYKGSWQRSGKRGAKKAKQRRWVRKAQEIAKSNKCSSVR
jgi:hypothetical protein